MAYQLGTRGILLLQIYIPPEYMDAMGHMNVQYYSRLFDSATWALFSLGGINAAYILEWQRGMAALEQHIRYFKEIREGTSIQIWSQVQLLGAKMLRLRHQMVEAKEDIVLAELDQKAIHLDLAGRKSRPFSEEIIEQFNKLSMECPLVED